MGERCACLAAVVGTSVGIHLPGANNETHSCTIYGPNLKPRGVQGAYLLLQVVARVEALIP
jgi:hypothetical protein